MTQLRLLVQEVVRDEMRQFQVTAVPQANEYLSTTQAASLLCTTAGTVRRWIRNGRLQKQTVEGRVLIRRADLETLIHPGTGAARAAPPKLSPEARATRDLANRKVRRTKLVDDDATVERK